MMFVQYKGDVQYTGACSVHWRDIMSSVGDIMSTLGMLSTPEDIMSTPVGYHDYDNFHQVFERGMPT